MIRFFCHADAKAAGDLSYSYLRAFDATGTSVRAIAIFGVDLAADGNARWEAESRLFVTPIQSSYINVVCAPAGMLWGMTNAADLSHASDLPVELALGPSAPRAPRATPDAAYNQQKTAFSGLFTVGCRNVAILTSKAEPDAKESRALSLYDLVVCPTPADALLLVNLGVKATYLPPHAAYMTKMIEGLCSESGTTAITPNSLAMDALREITSSPFTVPEEWRSRSETSPEGSSVPSGDTPSSTSSSSPAAVGWPRRMWRSITRTLWS